MSPRGGSASSWAAVELAAVLRLPARAAGDAVYSALGIPYYLRVEIARRLNSAELHHFEHSGAGYKLIASALAGERFEIERPFEVSFDPADLLEP